MANALNPLVGTAHLLDELDSKLLAYLFNFV